MPKPYNPHDKYMKKAKYEGYRARSVYKLEELDAKYHLLGEGMQVLDLASAPGSWLQYISEQVGPDGRVVGVDLQSIVPIDKNVQTFVGDVFDELRMEEILTEAKLGRIDLITSDIAPKTTGIPGVDSLKSIELNRQVVEVAKKHLKQQGDLVMKIFDGPNFPTFLLELREIFANVSLTRVQATRDRSSEFYAICQRKRMVR